MSGFFRVVFFLLFSFCHTSYACMCFDEPWTLSVKFKVSDVVIEAFVDAESARSWSSVTYNVTILRSFKGPFQPGDVAKVWTHSHYGACGFPLTIGKKYLLTAQFSEKPVPVLRIFTCGYNRPWEELTCSDRKFIETRKCLQPAQCLVDPCSIATCQHPQAICVPNPCGGCGAEFFLPDGSQVCQSCNDTCPCNKDAGTCSRDAGYCVADPPEEGSIDNPIPDDDSAASDSSKNRVEVSAVAGDSSKNQVKPNDAVGDSSKNQVKTNDAVGDSSKNRVEVSTVAGDSGKNRVEANAVTGDNSKNRVEVNAAAGDSSKTQVKPNNAVGDSSENRVEVNAVAGDSSKNQVKTNDAVGDSNKNGVEVNAVTGEDSKSRLETGDVASDSSKNQVQMDVATGDNSKNRVEVDDATADSSKKNLVETVDTTGGTDSSQTSTSQNRVDASKNRVDARKNRVDTSRRGDKTRMPKRRRYAAPDWLPQGALDALANPESGWRRGPGKVLQGRLEVDELPVVVNVPRHAVIHGSKFRLRR